MWYYTDDFSDWCEEGSVKNGIARKSTNLAKPHFASTLNKNTCGLTIKAKKTKEQIAKDKKAQAEKAAGIGPTLACPQHLCWRQSACFAGARVCEVSVYGDAKFPKSNGYEGACQQPYPYPCPCPYPCPRQLDQYTFSWQPDPCIRSRLSASRYAYARVVHTHYRRPSCHTDRKDREVLCIH